MKYLIAGLGNIGPEYEKTRHNTGFRVLDAFAEASNLVFTGKRYGDIVNCRLKNCELFLLKPSTFMNSSGLAVRYWMNKENIPIENVLVVVDDLSIPFGTLRLKGSGGSGGHNGLKSIQELIGEEYSRLKFGIGSDYLPGQQFHYVLGPFSDEEEQKLPERIKIAVEIVKSFCLAGVQLTMTQFNNK